MSTLAVFLLLAGGGAIAATKLKRNAVKSKNIAPEAVKGVDADEATFGKVPSAGSADTAGSANTASSANAVAPDSVGGAGIQNPTRSVNLPLASFVISPGGTLDFDSANAANHPDFDLNTPTGTGIEFDADGGNQDTFTIEAQFMVPPDYASGGSIAIRAARPTATGDTDSLNGSVSVNGGSQSGTVSTNLSGLASARYTLSPVPNLAYAAGRAVSFGLFVRSGGAQNDDDIWVQGVEFRYQAEQ